MKAARIVTINLWGDNGDVERRMRVLIPQLVALEPHIVTLQEAREQSGLRQVQRIAAALGAESRFLPIELDRPLQPLGNAIVSTFPIRAASHLVLPSILGDRRAALRCEVETPFGRWAITTSHLSHELDGSHAREEQAVALDAFAKADPGAIPSVLTGDLNCTPDSEVMRFLCGRVALKDRGTYWRDAYHRRHPRSDGFTWSSRNGFAQRSIERDRRIDYILVGPMHVDGPGSVLHSRVVLDLPGKDGGYPSDHFGVFAELSLVPPARELG